MAYVTDFRRYFIEAKESFVKFWNSSVLVLLIAFSGSTGRAQDLTAPALTLRDAINRALAANPAALRARSEIDFARTQTRFLRSSILPQVEFYGSSSLNDREVRFGGETDGTTILPSNDWNYRVVLSQPIYAGGRELKTLRQSRLNEQTARESLRGREEGLILQTATNYLGIVQGDELIAVERKNLELAERRRKQATDFFEAGEATRVELLRAETAIKAAQRRLAAATQFREASAGRLQLDLASDAPVGATEPTLALPAIPSEEELIRQAEAARPELRQAAFGAEIASLEVAKQRGRYLPTITADASYTRQKVQFPADEFAALTFNVYVPIWSSGAIGAQVSQARDREKQAQTVVEETRRAIREDVQLALLDLRTAETSLALAREQLAASEAEYEQTFELYQAQEATSLDLEASESSLADARRAVVTVTLDRELAQLRVWRAAGGLKSVVVSEVSQ